MIVTANLTGLNTLRHMDKIQKDNSRSIEKISSGYRINRGADDAAGLAVSEGMRVHVKGLKQANRNVQDGISLIQTAEAGLIEANKVLQRMRQLTIQAANDHLTYEDRRLIQIEMRELEEALNLISSDTEFNEINMLGPKREEDLPPMSLDIVFMIDDSGSMQNEIDAVKAGLSDFIDGVSAANFNIAMISIVGDRGLEGGDAPGGLVRRLDFTDDKNELLSHMNNYEVEFGSTSPYNYMAHSIPGGEVGLSWSQRAKKVYVLVTDTYDEAQGPFAGRPTQEEVAQILKGDPDTDEDDVTLFVLGLEPPQPPYPPFDPNVYQHIVDETGGQLYMPTTSQEITDTLTQNLVFDLEIDEVIKSSRDIKDIYLHVGSGYGQLKSITSSDIRSHILGVDNLNVLTSSSAEESLRKIDGALEEVLNERTRWGAHHRALNHLGRKVTILGTNQQQAESRIRDIDIAKEMGELARTQVLSGSSEAMLVKSIQTSQSVMQLIA